MSQKQEFIQRRKRWVFIVMIFGFLLLAPIFYVLYLITHKTIFEGLAVLAFIVFIIVSVIKDILEKECENAEKRTNE